MRYLSLVVLVLASFTNPAFSAELVDRIVAVVDGYPVLHSEIEEKVSSGPLVVLSEYPSEPEDDKYERAKHDAINIELVLSKARELGIEINDTELDAEISQKLEQMGTDKDGLMEFLQSQGKSFDSYREEFREHILMRRFQGRVIIPLVKITDKDIETYYLQSAGSSSDLLQLTLRQILIQVDPSASEEVVNSKNALSNEIHEKLKSGMKFEEGVKIYSDDASARDTGGLMESISINDLSGKIRKEVETLSPGQFSNPVRTAIGFHIFYLEEKKLAQNNEFQTKKRQLEFELRNRELANQTRRWIMEQRQRSKIELLN